MSATVAADLRAAADVLRRDGWGQHRLHGPDGCHCMLGAVIVAVTGQRHPEGDDTLNHADGARYDAAWDALRSYLHTVPPMWNDAPGRTVAEVIAALEAAADAAEATS